MAHFLREAEIVGIHNEKPQTNFLDESMLDVAGRDDALSGGDQAEACPEGGDRAGACPVGGEWAEVYPAGGEWAGACPVGA